MIKFAWRRNLIYPLQLIIWHLSRNIETKLISYLFNFSGSLTYTPLMFLGEFISGLLLFLYQKHFLKKKKVGSNLFSTILIYRQQTLRHPDHNIKIFFLIFCITFFDWIQFLIWTVNVPKYLYISSSIVSRLSGILAISCALFYYYILRLQIFKHQIFSLIISGICAIIVIITEFFFQDINIFLTYTDFIVVLFLAFLSQILNAVLDTAEKYLFEINYVNPFFTLMFEGIFGFFLSFIFFAFPNYLDDIKTVYNTFSAGYLVLFSFLLLLYIILSGGRNIFRVITTKLYSPTARALTDYFLNPLYLIYDFSLGNDFLKQNERNIPYFIINLIISIIISICGCVYNELLILFFCGFERDTHDQVSKRSASQSELEIVESELENDDN